MNLPKLKTTRRSLQILIALSFIVIPYLNSSGYHQLKGNFLSFDFWGLPLADPLAALQVSLKNWPSPNELLIGAGIALLLALVLGAVFCSWACPYGFMSELAQELNRRLFSARPGMAAQPDQLVWKCYLTALGLAAVLVLAMPPVLNQLSFPGWYSRLFQMVFLQNYWSWAGLVILCMLALELMVGQRIWCRYLCPQALLLVVIQHLNPFRLKIGFNPSACSCKIGTHPCQTSCSLAINPKEIKGNLDLLCNNCGDCVVKCSHLGSALNYQLATRSKRT